MSLLAADAGFLRNNRQRLHLPFVLSTMENLLLGLRNRYGNLPGVIRHLPYVSLAAFQLKSNCNIEIGSMEMVMKACVLCIDESTSRSTDRLTTLEAAGFGVLNASDEPHAVELLGSHRVDVICIASQAGDAQKSGMGRSIKRVRPDVPVVLIHSQGNPPAHFEEYADIVIDEPDFRAMTRWLIEALQEAPNLFFVRWFVNWMRRPPQPATQAGGVLPNF